MKSKLVYLICVLGFLAVPPICSEELRLNERDFEKLVERSEYEGVSKSVGLVGRHYQYHLVDETHHRLAAHLAGLDARREAIVDAIMRGDASAFYELAKSPLSHEGGLKEQTFSSLVRELKRLDRWPLRTLRQHPTISKQDQIGARVLACHQWMTLPRKNQNPRRGNLYLIFNPDDWSLESVQINFFNADRIIILPMPDSRIPNDPVKDRKFPEED